MIEFCTNRREPAVHICPPPPKIPEMAPATACSRSASSNTIFGDLPPNSIATRFIWRAAASYTLAPVMSEPVKVIMATSRCSTKGAPISFPSPVTTFRTPSGNPACLVSATNSNELADENSEGLTTAEHPAAKAGAHLSAKKLSGAFQAVNASTTPMGSRVVNPTTPAFSIGITEPSILSASPA
ncbi:hypothetical protein D3C85_1103020 [compost metagenome]